MSKLKVFEMFSGFGGAEFALKKAGIEHEVVGYSEIDKYAIKCWEQNHITTTKNWGDCTKINPEELPDFDLLTGGFPCQSFSVAGKGQGVNDEKGRGVLFNDILRILKVKKPKYILLENVKGLLGKKHKEFFDFIQNSLKQEGYDLNIDVYTSSEHGTPQKRQRVFIVGMLGNNTYKRIKKEDTPNIFESKLLIEKVDEKFYLSNKALERLRRGGFRNNCNDGWCMTQTATQYKKNWQTPVVADFRYDEGIRPWSDKFSPTLTTRMGYTSLSGSVIISFDLKTYRYLTPNECFRLMGFFNDEINLDGISDTQRYKLAGNGWDINLVSKIFKQMFEGTEWL